MRWLKIQQQQQQIMYKSRLNSWIVIDLLNNFFKKLKIKYF